MAKLNKQLAQAIVESGIEDFYEFQDQLIARVSGGGSIYLTGAASTGKTTAAILAVLQKLNYSMPDTPRALFLVSDAKDARVLFETVKKFSKHMDLISHLVTEEGIMDEQNIAIYTGADILVATPGRYIKLYFQCGINVNKMNLLVLDDCNKLAQNRQLVELDRIVDSFPKFQTILIDTVLDPRMIKACTKFVKHPQELLAQIPAANSDE